MDRGDTQKSFKAIVSNVGIHKGITIHTLRHRYGTLLTDMGVSLRAIQEQMGHKCPKTTALYTQLFNLASTLKSVNVAAVTSRWLQVLRIRQ